MTTRYTGVILTGGQNIRMQGRIKAFLEFGGITFLDRIFTVLSALFSEIILVTKDPELYESWRDRTRVVRDILAPQALYQVSIAAWCMQTATMAFVLVVTRQWCKKVSWKY